MLKSDNTRTNIPQNTIFEKALQSLKRLNPDRFELFLTKVGSTKIDAKDGQVDSLSQSEDQGLAVRVLHRNRMGFSFTTSLDPLAIERTVETAMMIAHEMPEDPDHTLLSFREFQNQYPDHKPDAHYDRAGIQREISQKTELALALEKTCRDFDPRIAGVRSASLSQSIEEIWLMDSEETVLHYPSTLYRASVTCRAQQGEQNQMGSDSRASRFLDALEWKEAACTAAEEAVELLGAGRAPTLTCPALFRPSVVTDFLGFLASSLSSEELAKGRSLLAGKQGQSIFSPCLTLVNDGVTRTAPFDAEGVPAQRVSLIEKGVFKQPLYNLYYARKAGAASSGTAARSLKSAPRIGLRDFFLEPGSQSAEQMMSELSKGVLITDIQGLHTANSITGDFSLGASGFLIENGKVTKPIQGFAIAGNILKLFQNVTAVGSDFRFFGGGSSSIGASSLLVSELSIGGN